MPGRPTELWYKWKRQPFNVDAVMMYARRGYGKRASFYSDDTFGAWTDGPEGEVVHTRDEGLVFEILFEGLNRSTRQKPGVAMRFPRMARIRWDSPTAEANRFDVLEKMSAAES